jgi:hypothetical protein
MQPIYFREDPDVSGNLEEIKNWSTRSMDGWESPEMED